MAIPVDLDAARRQLNMRSGDLSPDRQAELQGFIADAAAWVERYTGHILVAREVTATLDGFGALELAAWPIKPGSVPVVAYDAGAGVVPVAAVRADISRRPARILPSIGARWPVVAAGTPVTVTIRAGYEAGDPVPGNFRRAMLVLIGAYDSDREGGDILAKAEASARSLCRDFRVKRV